MKKYISLALSVIMLLSVVFTVPRVFAENLVSIVNTYDDEGITITTGGVNMWWVRNAKTGVWNDSSLDDLNGWDYFALGSFSLNGVDGSRAYAFQRAALITGGKDDNMNAVRIYDSNDADKKLWIPESNKAYSVSFKYKLNAAAVSHDMYMGLRTLNGANGSNGKFSSGEELAKLLTIEADTLNADIWYQASGVFTMDDTACDSVSLALMSSEERAIANIMFMIDDIEIKPYTENGDTQITIHNYNGENENYVIEKAYSDDFSSIEIPENANYTFVGLYLDEACTIPATGMIKNTNELWIKWKWNGITNTYDDEGITITTGGLGMWWVRNAKASAWNDSSLDELNGWDYFALGAFVTDDSDTVNNTQHFNFGSAGIADANLNAVRLYDSNDANKKLWVPKKETTYQITFQYKLDEKATSHDSYFAIRTLNGANSNNGKFSSGIELANVQTVSNGTLSAGTWHTATGIFTTGSNDCDSLCFTWMSSEGSMFSANAYIDNINITEGTLAPVVSDTKNINTYDDAGVTINVAERPSGKNYVVYSRTVAKNSEIDKIGGYNCFAFGSFETVTFSGATSKAFKFSRATKETGNATAEMSAVKIYNSTDPNKAILTPKKNTTYKISFKYSMGKDSSYTMIGKECYVALRTVKDATSATGLYAGEEIAKLLTVTRDSIDKWSSWETVETTFTTDANLDADSFCLSLMTEHDGTANWFSSQLYIDDIEIEAYQGPDTSVITCYDYNGEGNDAEFTRAFTENLSSIPTPTVFGQKFEGFYLDSEYTKPADGLIWNTTELWAKWRTTSDSIVNNYDDEDVYYQKGNYNYIYRYSDSEFTDKIDTGMSFSPFMMGNILDDGGIDGSRAMNLDSAASKEQSYPAAIRIYDNNDTHKKLYAPHKNTVYKLSFKYKQNANIKDNIMIYIKGMTDTSGTFGKGDTLARVVWLGEYEAVKDWKYVECYFMVGDKDYVSLGLYPMTSASATLDTLDFCIDDLELTEIMDVRYLTLDTCGSSMEDPIPFVPGEALLDNLTVPVKNGYVFSGWYTDSEYRNVFSVPEVMPDRDINLYAKWVPVATEAKSFYTGFEASDFQYANNGTNANVSDNYISNETTVINDSYEAFGGENYIHLENEWLSGAMSTKLNAFALVQPDGEYYQLMAGQRYKITYAARVNNYAHIVVATADQIPAGYISMNNSSSWIDTFYHCSWYGPEDTWYEIEEYFTPETSGKAYMYIYYKTGYLDLDNIRITPVSDSEATYVNYYRENSTTLIRSSFGGAGKPVVSPKAPAKAGYVFDGWVDKNGIPFTSSAFPTSDLNVYASYRPASNIDLNNVSTDWVKSEYNFDVDSDKAAAFYASGENCLIDESGEYSHATCNNHAGVYFVSGDSEGAHSGDSYFRFYRAGHWTASQFRRMRVFDPDSEGNMVYLKPNSVYQVSFWMRVDGTNFAGLRLATLDTTENMEILSQEILMSINDIDFESIYGQWVKYEGTIATSDVVSTLGFVISGGYLSASIDDISVKRLLRYNVSFQTNGGNEIESKSTLEGNIVYPPASPVKEGYSFLGWYSDKELKNAFNFFKTPITSDIVLYAAWGPASERIPQYRTETTYIDEIQIVDKELEDAHLDEQIKVVKNDKANAASNNNSDGIATWLLILIIIGSVLLLAVVAIIVIILLKKSKK